MTGRRRGKEPAAGPEGGSSRERFLLHVRDALPHVHDLAYLETHSLTEFLPRRLRSRQALSGRILRWLTTTGGQAWTNISGALPNAPINAIVVNPRDPKVIYVGTDTGVYRSPDSGTTWVLYDSGLPNAVMNDLVFSRAGTVLVAFTHGRSAHMTSVLPIYVPIVGREFEQ